MKDSTNSEKVDPVIHIYSYIQRFGSRSRGKISDKEMLELKIPYNYDELLDLIVEAEINPKPLEDYYQRIQEESNSIKNAVQEPIGDRQIGKYQSKLSDFYYFTKAVECIVENCFTEETDIIDAKQLKENKDKIKTVFKSAGKNLSDIDLEMKGAIKFVAASKKLNRHNPKADLESFKGAGVYAYQAESDVYPNKSISQNDIKYYKRKDVRERNPDIQAKVKFNIPLAQKEFIQNLKRKGIDNEGFVNKFERESSESPVNKKQKVTRRYNTPF
jgi:hypothetical protein